MTRFVPETFMMVYAPRTGLEVQTVMDIVMASVWWVGGEDIVAYQEERDEKQVRGVSCAMACLQAAESSEGKDAVL